MTDAWPIRWAEGMPLMDCQVCASEVPEGDFCGLCGARESGSGAPDRWRVGAFAAAPGEHVLRLSLASTLFPRLPHRSRSPFRIGLGVVVLAMVVFAVLGWQAALIATGTWGLPVLFVIYLYESDAYKDIPLRNLIVTALLGLGLGVGWAAVTGRAVARSYAAALDSGVSGERLWRDGVLIPLGSAFFSLVPVIVVRLLRPARRDSLDGFVVGALGAISFVAAGTITRLAPQLASGVVAPHRPILFLVAQAGIQGVALPLIAAGVGGLVGVTLWFRRPRDKPGLLRRPELTAALVILLVLAGFAALGLIDVAQLPLAVQLGIYIAVAAVVLVALRVVLHTALLSEPHRLNPEQPMICPHCEHVVPELAFCPHCGVAVSAAPGSMRSACRLPAPQNDSPDEP